MSDNKKFERFGRYLILDHLVNGGMAKICRARFLGEQADKVVAIKMVQPQYSADESFKTMFMDEIKTTFGLLHPNIVQTYDYGLHNDQLFVAMEYCDGRNLKEYLDKLKARNFVFPVEISTFITIQACQGLHYAHTLVDKLTGKPANIIHRDISPHNIMLTFDGAVKVIDFGIAKSETNSEATQAGTIKGKLSYLAPEYLEGHELDPRYDLFAVGITLWELLCSRKLFKASNDLAVLKKIQECKVPKPSSINPNVPEELDQIVLKALRKDPNQRYKNLEEFARALNKFLFANYPDFNPADLSYFAKELFKDEIKKDRESLYSFGQIDIKPYLAELKNEMNGGGSSSSPASGSTPSDPLRKVEESMLDFDFDEDDASSEDLLGRKKKKSTGTVSSLQIGDALKNDKTRTKINKLDMTDATRKSTIKKVKKKTKKRVKKPAKKSNAKSILVASVAVVALAVGYFAFSGGDTKPKVAKAESKKIERVPSSNQKFEVKIKGYNKRKEHKVFVNGKLTKPDVLNNIKLPVGNYTIRIERPGFQHFVVSEYEVKDKLNILEIERTPFAPFGYLYTSHSCFSGEIHFELYGEKRVERAPIRTKPGIPFPAEYSNDGLVVPVEYQIGVKRAGQDIKKTVIFKIEEDKQAIDLCQLL